MSAPRPCLCGCVERLPEGARPGKPQRFLNPEHRLAFYRAARQVGAATLADQAHPLKPTRQRGPSPRTQQVSRFIFLAMVPPEKRAELLRQAAEQRGITDSNAIDAALKRNGCAPPPLASHLRPATEAHA